MHWGTLPSSNTGSTSVALDCIENMAKAFTCLPHSVSTPANLVVKLNYFWEKTQPHGSGDDDWRLPKSETE